MRRPSKQKLVNWYSTFKNFLYGILVYKVKKSNVVMDSSLLRLCKFLILVNTASLFETAQKLLIPEK